MAYYVQPHVTQFDGGSKQGEACVPAALANGVAASTGGARKPASQTVHALIPKSQETDPSTPGWSMADADHAMAKIGIPFDRGSGWNHLEAAHGSGHYVIVQGDSDQFSNSTCSGKFNGAHCIGVHPKSQVVSGHTLWWIDDPICRTGRWERKSVIRDYAEKFNASVSFGSFTNAVPAVGAPPKPPTVVLRYGGTKLSPRQVKRIKVPAGRRANIRRRPDRIRAGDIVGTLANGRTFTAYQRTTHGASLAGSRVWYGDQAGARWLHSSSF
jgi:hypothetical protein